MNDVTIAQRTDVAKFKPEEALPRDAAHDARISLAARLQDWSRVDQEVDKKLDDQQDFVNWWGGNVSRGKGGDRKSKDQSNRSVTLISASKAEELYGISKMQVSRWSKRLLKRDQYRASIVAAAYKKWAAQTSDTHVSNNSGENEWYTPPDIIEAARRVMGSIDFDPASSEIANRTVAAEMYCTARNDGLKQKWHGNVWMNPPYAQPLCAHFCNAVSEKAESGEIEQACVLVNNATETTWFQGVLTVAAAVCFLKGRVKFIDPDGNPSGSPLQGQAVIYLGPNKAAFYDEFRRMGTVLFHG